jgi:hypothetical protein
LRITVGKAIATGCLNCQLPLEWQFARYTFDYLKDLFTRLPAARIAEIREFTPATWAKTHARQKTLPQAA